MRELYILAFPIRLNVEELFIVNPMGRPILEVRHLLNSKEIPNTVLRDGIVAATNNPSIFKELRLEFTPLANLRKGRELTLDLFVEEITLQSRILNRLPFIKARLASSALGIYLKKKGLHRAYAKFFNPYSGESLNDRYRISAHDAFVAEVHYLPGSKTGYVLALDPCVKLEAYTPLSELNLSEIKNIDRVKVRGLSPSKFKLLEVIDKPNEDQREIAVKTLEALKRLHPNLPTRLMSDRIAKVTPCSYQLLEYFKEANLMRTEPDSHQPFVYLPSSVLYPVASFDELKALKVDVDKKKLKFWIGPSERYEKAINYVREILLRDKNQGGIRIGGISIFIQEEIISVNRRDKTSCTVLVKSKNDSYQNVKLSDIPNKRLWTEEISPIKIGLLPKVAIACSNVEAFETISLLEKYLKSYLSSITKVNAEVELLSNGRSSRPIFDSVEDVINLAKRNSFNVIVLVGKGDEEEYARFEYELSSINDKTIVPQYIDGQKIAAIKVDSSAKRSHAIARYIDNVAYTIVKCILPKLDWRYVKLEAPEVLNNAVIVGVDKTYVNIKKGVSLAVAAVLQSADGLRMNHLPPLLVENERDAVLQVAKKVKGESYDGPIIFCINRSYIPMDVYTELQNLLGEQLIVVSASKTHSMSRLLEKEGKTFVNPMLGSYAVLEEDKSHGRYLVASTFLEGKDRTIKPTLVEIMIAGVNIDARKVLNYISSTQALCIETPYNVASLPWPLHRAHNLSEKISKITRITRNIPQNLDVL
ncbi:MAG: hypothetical protein QW794_05355 [Thermosphaera sp.]